MSTTDHAYREVATEPLFPKNDRRAFARTMLGQLEAFRHDHREKYYHECWQSYITQHPTPATWRGRKDSHHYNRLMAGITRISRSRPMKVRIHYDEHFARRVDGGRLPRVQLAEYLRAHIRKFKINIHDGRRDAADVLAWFRSLSVEDQRAFADIQRNEEAQRKRERRMIDRFNSRYREYLDSPFLMQDEQSGAL